MSHVPPGRSEVGETVASYPSYEAAQKAVSTLIAADVPARDIAIVGSGLRSIERITGKLGYATAARSGAVNGILLGLFFSALFLLGNDKAPPSAFVGVLLVGVALGMLFSLGAYAVIRRRKDFASVMQVIADHYEVTVLPGSIHRAREVLGPMTTVARPPRHRAGYGDRDDVPREPPRYGERTDGAPRAPHRGERIVPAPKYGERIEPAAPEYGERVDTASDTEPGEDADGDDDAQDVTDAPDPTADAGADGADGGAGEHPGTVVPTDAGTSDVGEAPEPDDGTEGGPAASDDDARRHRDDA